MADRSRRRALAGLLLAAGLAGPALPAAAATDPLVTTTWEVRRDAEELLADLRQQRGDPGTLVERAQALLAAHGEDLVARDGLFAPLSEVLADELAKAGLAERFVATYAGLAGRRLDELRAAGGEDAEWRRLAHAFPGTPAARAAWSALADRAWDHGRLGSFVASARRSGEAADAARARRLQAGLDLLAERPALRLPQSLETDEMWRLEVEQSEVRQSAPRRGRERPQTTRSFALSAPTGDLVAASDGVTAFVIDHLVGRRVGDLHPVGTVAIDPRASVPVAARGVFIALGRERDESLVLVGLDPAGTQRWRVRAGGNDTWVQVSAPVALDDKVVFAGLVQQEEGPELRVVAHRVADGAPVWDRFVAKLPMLLNRAFVFDDGDGRMGLPSLCVHQGGLLVLANTGMMARLAADGAVERIWTYPTGIANVEDRWQRRQERGRAGVVRSDGRWALATPADAEGLALVLGPDDEAPRRYVGDGARGEVIDVADGCALLGGRQLTLLDLAAAGTDTAKLKPRWHRVQASADATGLLGRGHALLATRERLLLLDSATGAVVSDRPAEPPTALAASDGMLVVANRGTLVAYGNAKAFLEEQLARARRDPADPRPLVALGKLALAQGDHERAYDWLVQALERGAPAEYAVAAARPLRTRLERSLDDERAFADAAARLDRLAAFAPVIADEALWWRARRGEAAGDAAGAIAAYRALLDRPAQRLAVGIRRDDQLDASLHALARGGLARLKATEPPAWLRPAPPPPPATPVDAAWESGQARRGAYVAGDVVLGFEGGVLAARSLRDGSEAWRRRPDSPMLGVKLVGAPGEEPGVEIEVIEGTAAAAAGLRNGDRLLAFNGTAIRDFNRDLIPAVTASTSGSEFTLRVQRAGKELDLSGRLGGELVEVVAANARTVLVWPVAALRAQRAQREGMWVAALDLRDGSQVWRGGLPPATVDHEAPAPLLTADDLLVAVDGADLVGIAIRDPQASRERWRLAGLAPWFERARTIADGVLLIADPAHGQARLLDLASGETLFAFACDPERDVLLEGGDLVVRATDGHLACWDLGLGRLRWRSDKPAWNPVALSGDAVFALDEKRQLVSFDRANGRQRRLYGDWTGVDEVAVAPGRLYLEAARGGGARAVAALGLPGGAVLWERPLPLGTEVRDLAAGAGGVACVVIEPSQRPSLLALDPDGGVAVASVLADDQSARPLPGGALIISPKGLAVRTPASIATPAPVPAVAAAPRETLATTAAGVLPSLAWQKVGKATYAIARLDGSLLVFARLPPEVEAMEVRLGDVGPQIDALNQAVIFQRHRIARLTNNKDDGWRVNGSQKLPAEVGVWLCVSRLDPPVGRLPGSEVQIRASAGNLIDGAEAPWWLRAGWRLVVPAEPRATP